MSTIISLPIRQIYTIKRIVYRPYICSMSCTGPPLNCRSFSVHAEILFLFVTMYVFRAECKSRQVLVLLLLCGREDTAVPILLGDGKKE